MQCKCSHVHTTSSCCRILDNLPVAIAVVQGSLNVNDPDQGIKTYERGFPVGYVSEVEVCEVPDHTMLALLR